MPVTDEMVEVAAKELCLVDEQDGGPPWDALPLLFPRLRRQDGYRESARAALQKDRTP
jgi:hypothetical protein